MKQTTLNNLVDLLFKLLSPKEMRWVAEQLTGFADIEDPKPYTIEELHERIAQSERDFAEGRWIDSEEMFRELDEEFSRDMTIEELFAAIEQDVKAENEETMSVEELRAMLQETVRKEYARGRIESRGRALDKDMTPEQLYSVIMEEVDDIYKS